MTLAIAVADSSSFLTQVAFSAARALVLGAGVGLGLAGFRVRSTSARLFTWTMVLYAALAMPLLGRILPPLSVPTPGFLQWRRAQLNEVYHSNPSVAVDENASIPGGHSAKQPSFGAASGQTPSSPSFTTGAQNAERSTGSRTSAPFFWPPIRWSVIVAAVYFVVALLLLIRFIVGLVLTRRLIHASGAIQDERLVRKIASRACSSGLELTPAIAESECISVPVTVGAVRYTILLPAGWQDWDEAKLDAVVAHEVSHAARHDGLTQCLALLHRAIFWFSPLAWWLEHHLAALAEQASDEVALSCGADCHDYARTLLGFFEALHAAPRRIWWQGVAMAKAGQAEQRVERILAWRGAVTMNLQKSVAVVALAVVIPVIYLAASVRPESSNPRSQSTEHEQQTAPVAADQVAPPVPAVVPAMPAGPPAPAVGAYSETDSAPVAPTAAGVPVGPIPPAAPAASAGQSNGTGTGHGRGYSYAYGFVDEERFVIVSGNSDTLTVSGSSQDARHVEQLKKRISGDFIWFQRDEKSYIIRDQAMIDRARKLWVPQEELGRKQEELGRQQEALGKQQSELGAKMSRVQVKVPDMTAELDRLRAKLKELSSGATVEQVGELQSEIGELQSKIGEIQSHADEQQSKVGEEMSALGEKQGKLGEQQGELGEQQAKLAGEASRKMKELFDEAISKHLAQPEPERSSML